MFARRIAAHFGIQLTLTQGTFKLDSMKIGTVILGLSLFGASLLPARAQSKADRAPLPPGTQTYTREGVSVEFTINSSSPTSRKPGDLMSGATATFNFKIHDANVGKTIGNLRPSVWIDRRENGEVSKARECREKIQSFLQPSLNAKPIIDLNSYFLVALNSEASISVIDPIGGFGGSRLYALVALPSPGADWVLSADKKRLYVSMPAVNQVAVVDTSEWKLIGNVDAGTRPTRLALQHDGRYLWIGNDGAQPQESTVAAFDTATMKVAVRLRVGSGHHELVVNDDDRFVFATNKEDGTLSIIDVRKLAKTSDVKVGEQPAAVAFSPASKAVYVGNERDGTITVVDAARFQIIARMKSEPGLRAIRFAPDGRYGLAVNESTNKAYVFDASSNRIMHSVAVEPGPDNISFTKEFAYVHSTGSEFVSMIKVTELEKEKELAMTRFPAGQKAPKEFAMSFVADAIVPAPDDTGVFVANPADKMIYFYAEGMAAPMGAFQNYRRDPKALLIIDNGLTETTSGVYTTTIRLPAAGHYDVAFLLDSPRLVNCFDLTVAENPALPKTARVLKIEPISNILNALAGESYKLRFKVTDAESNSAKANLTDVGVLVFLAPGVWQQRDLAKSLGDGIYEINFVPPQTGVYYVYFQCPSLDLKFNQTAPLIIQAIKK
jgi:YVTN family beta-propeller protein